MGSFEWSQFRDFHYCTGQTILYNFIKYGPWLCVYSSMVFVLRDHSGPWTTSGGPLGGPHTPFRTQP